jgi:putative component of membrane protein insertase Oxa1/YidC/SpoIIIJ protein YidD
MNGDAGGHRYCLAFDRGHCYHLQTCSTYIFDALFDTTYNLVLRVLE